MWRALSKGRSITNFSALPHAERRGPSDGPSRRWQGSNTTSLPLANTVAIDDILQRADGRHSGAKATGLVRQPGPCRGGIHLGTINRCADGLSLLL